MNIFTSICDRIEAALGTTVIRIEGDRGERDTVICMSNKSYEAHESALEELIEELETDANAEYDSIIEAMNTYGAETDE